jgi:hypothetical protein
MRTLVITGSEPTMWNVLDLTLNSKYKWCQKNGYDILVKRTWAANPKLGFTDNWKHLGFLRAVVCFEQLRYYDNVMWLDGDSIITNQDYKIEDFINEESCFFASYNWCVEEAPNGAFTTGNFVIRRDIKSHIEQLYNYFLQVSKHFLSHILQELATFNTIYSDPSFKHMFNILPHKYLNACPEVLRETATWTNDKSRVKIFGPWDSDCFLAHLTGCSNEERYEILKTHFSSYL